MFNQSFKFGQVVWPGLARLIGNELITVRLCKLDCVTVSPDEHPAEQGKTQPIKKIILLFKIIIKIIMTCK